MRGQETDHVISGPMRGLEKNCIQWRRQTDKLTSGHCNSTTDSAQRAESVKIGLNRQRGAQIIFQNIHVHKVVKGLHRVL